jgi:hypothetical protein
MGGDELARENSESITMNTFFRMHHTSKGVENGKKHEEIMAKTGHDHSGTQQAGGDGAHGVQGMHQSTEFGSVEGIVQVRHGTDAGLLRLLQVLTASPRQSGTINLLQTTQEGRPGKAGRPFRLPSAARDNTIDGERNFHGESS